MTKKTAEYIQSELDEYDENESFNEEKNFIKGLTSERVHRTVHLLSDESDYFNFGD